MSHPWMPFYVADYLADTGHLSTVEHGAYMLLIMHYWQHGGLPNDSAKLARICRMPLDEWGEINDTMAALFKDGWRHDRIDDELAKAQQLINKRKGAGAKGAEGRWGTGHQKMTRSERLTTARNNGSHTPAEWLAMVGVFGGCVKCGTPVSQLHGGVCSKDHIVPIYQGGNDSIENIQPMCRNCNSRKGGETKDFRGRIPDWRERLAKRLANDSVTAGPSQPQPHLATQEPRDEFSDIERRCREAAGLENDPSPSLLDPSPIVGLIRKGYDLTADILPKLREAKAKGKRPKTWAYFVPAIEQSKAASDAIKPNERDKPGEPVTWLSMDDPLWKGVAERYREAKGKPPIHYAGRGGMGFHFPTDMVLEIPRELRREPAPLSG